MPEFKLPEFKLPELPDFKLPELPEVDLEDVAQKAAKLAKDAVYVTVGAGVLAFQRAQVQRREFQKAVDERVGAGREQVENVTKSFEDQIRLLDERVTALESRIDTVLDQVQGKLPEQAAELLQQAREAARNARSQVRELVLPTPTKPAPAKRAAKTTRKATKAA